MKFVLDKRKIQKTDYTLWVSLPSVWVKSLKLNKGDYLRMEIGDDGTLELKKDEKTQS
jgi:antitoxin component of MazEF toxin-antitoxin module